MAAIFEELSFLSVTCLPVELTSSSLLTLLNVKTEVSWQWALDQFESRRDSICTTDACKQWLKLFSHCPREKPAEFLSSRRVILARSGAGSDFSWWRPDECLLNYTKSVASIGAPSRFSLSKQFGDGALSDLSEIFPSTLEARHVDGMLEEWSKSNGQGMDASFESEAVMWYSLMASSMPKFVLCRVAGAHRLVAPNSARTKIYFPDRAKIVALFEKSERICFLAVPAFTEGKFLSPAWKDIPPVSRCVDIKIVERSGKARSAAVAEFLDQLAPFLGGIAKTDQRIPVMQYDTDTLRAEIVLGTESAVTRVSCIFDGTCLHISSEPDWPAVAHELGVAYPGVTDFVMCMSHYFAKRSDQRLVNISEWCDENGFIPLISARAQ